MTADPLQDDAARYGIWSPSADMRDLLRALLDLAPPTPAAMALLQSGLAADADPGLKRLVPLGASKPWTTAIASTAAGAAVERAAAVRALTFERFAARVVGALNQLGIEPLLLKGYPLARIYYDDPGHRPASDLDLLVHPEDAARALAALTELGFQPVADPGDPRLVHALGLWHEQERFELDLHWNTLYCARWKQADDGFWSRAVRFDTRAGRALTLSAGDHLIHACLHGRRANSTSPFRWVIDAGRIVTRSDPPVDWNRLVETAIEQRYPGPLSGCLRYLRDVIGLPIPADVIDRLAEAPMSSADRAFFRLETSAYEAGGPIRKFATLRVLFRRQAGADGLSFVQWLRLRWGVGGERGVAGHMLWRLLPPALRPADARPPVAASERRASRAGRGG